LAFLQSELSFSRHIHAVSITVFILYILVFVITHVYFGLRISN